jgi:hypothetical protein
MWPRPAAPFEGAFVTIVSVSLGEDEESILVVFSENPTAVPGTDGAIDVETDAITTETSGSGVNHGSFWTLGLDDSVDGASSGTWRVIDPTEFVFASGKTLAPGQTGPVIFP